MQRKKIVVALVSLAAAAALAACVFFLYRGTAPAVPFARTKTGFAMNTAVTLTAYAQDGAASDDLNAELLREISKLENQISWNISSSETAKINRAAGAEFVEAPTVAGLLRQTAPVCEASGGLLSPLMLPLSRLWDVTGDSPSSPQPEEITAAAALCEADGYTLDGDCVKLLHKGAGLDFGAFGKGAACDRLAACLQASDAPAAVCSVGGSVLVYGRKPDDTDWLVSIAVPGDSNRSLGELAFSDTAFLSTSGSYERYFIEDGKRYHHILNPETGYPAETGLASVTVASDTGVLSDALSTACFLLGYEKSLPLLKAFSAEAVFVTEDRTVYVTSGLSGRFRLTDKDYVRKEAAQ